MSRMVGTVSRGIRTPIIRSGDDLVESVTSFLLEAGRDGQSLIHTPTMRTPQRILDARVIYQCMRTTLMCAAEHAVESIVIPMFGGATGGVRPHLAADMMWRAYAQLKNPPERLDWAYAAEVEIDLP